MKDKKCYSCMMVVDGHAAVCPKCEAKLGRRLPSGMARKPGFPFIKLFLVLAALGAVVKLTGYSHLLNAAPEKAVSAEAVAAKAAPADARDAAIKGIKEKGAANLGSVGVNDIGYKDDTLLVYVDKRFTGLSKEQQSKLLVLVAGEWQEAVGKESVPVKLLETGTDRIIAELEI
ncbi:MAG: hypothetical protein HY550_10905 [Elusimicrobia bacterium]|nr:hypothetical protein [Elusimicrobiota bacterium]